MIREIAPDYAREMFIEAKRGSVQDSTVRAYKFPTQHFIDFLSDADVESMNEVDGFHLEQWRLTRKRDDIADATLQTHCKRIRHFLNWCADKEIVSDGLADKLTIPNVAEKDMVSDEKVPLAQAEEVLGHLNTYEYATLYHTLFEVMWETACRISGAIALDIEDFEPDPEPTAENPDPSPYLRFRHRAEADTTLKNGRKSERNVTISERTAGLLVDYLSKSHHGVVDDYDRNPLFCTQHKRLSRQRAYKAINRYTRPCIYSGNCPHDREIDACEYYVDSAKAMTCPSSKSLHPIRRGSITHHLNRGWPKEALSDRADVSVEILEKHYDARTHENKREGRRQYVDLL